MRNLKYLAAFALVACGYSEDKFAEDFAAKMCDMIVECGGDPCADATGTDTTGTTGGTCDFDAGAAKECVDAKWECSEEVGGISFPIPADVCANVCGGGGAETTGT